MLIVLLILFFSNVTATTEIYTLFLHDALPISALARAVELKPEDPRLRVRLAFAEHGAGRLDETARHLKDAAARQGSQFADRKSTRLNSSHGYISYAVFCLKKKKKKSRRHYRHH